MSFCADAATTSLYKYMMLSSNGNMVNGEFLTQRPLTQSFDVFFDLHLDKRLSKQSRLYISYSQRHDIYIDTKYRCIIIIKSNIHSGSWTILSVFSCITSLRKESKIIDDDLSTFLWFLCMCHTVTFMFCCNSVYNMLVHVSCLREDVTSI